MRKIIAVFLLLGLFAVLTVPTAFSQDSEYDVVEGEESFDQEEWSDLPNYLESLETEIVYSDTIQERKSAERCSSYVNRTYENGANYTECDSYETYFYGAESDYIFDIENIETRYMGNGEVYLAFDITTNEMSKELHKADNNPRQEEKFITWFNKRYLFNGRNISTGEDLDRFLDFTKSVSVDTLGGSVRGKRLESKNLHAVSNSRIETVVKLRDFRSGGVKLNDAVGVRLKSSLYNGGGDDL